MKKIRLIALLLAVIMLFTTACNKTVDTADNTEDNNVTDVSPDNNEENEEEGFVIDDSEGPVFTRYPYGSEWGLCTKEPIDIPKLKEMEYVHIDATELIEGIEDLTTKIFEYNNVDTLFKDYYDIYMQYREFQSMRVIGYYKYGCDVNDTYYSEEYEYCSDQFDIINEDMSKLYAAMGASSLRDALEDKYFYPGYFEDYDDFEEASEEVFDLRDEETSLEMKYLAYTSDGDASKHYAEIADVFIDLVKIRQKIATEYGYSNYLEYSYKNEFCRDYTPSDARTFIDGIKEELSPLGYKLYYSEDSPSENIYDFGELLYGAAKEMGGVIEDSARLLIKYELYDIEADAKKRAIGYQWYIPKYEVPFIFAYSPKYKTLCHEFGHFCDSAFNYGVDSDNDTAEIYSQAMEYLAMSYTTAFPDSVKKTYVKGSLGKLYDSLMWGALAADFELQVYSMNPDELTPEVLNGIFKKVSIDYNYNNYYNKEDWIYIHHFFDFPVYCISYATSVIPSLLISKAEYDKKGEGVKLFNRLLERTYGKHFLGVLTEAGIDNPFEKETIKKTADFFKEYFGIE